MRSLLFLPEDRSVVQADGGTIIEAVDGFQVAPGRAAAWVLESLARSPCSMSELVQAGSGISEVEIRQCIGQLLASEVIRSLPAPLTPASAELWSSIGVSASVAAAHLSDHPVRLDTVHADGRRLASALADWSIAPNTDLEAATVVVAADPLDAGLETMHAAAQRLSRAWWLVVPSGTGAWTMRFGAYDGACWACLRDRLLYNRPARALAGATARPQPSVPAAVAEHVARAIARSLSGESSGPFQRWTRIGRGGPAESHPVPPVSTCGACASRPRSDGYEQWISPVTGLVRDLRVLPSPDSAVVAAVRYRFAHRSESVSALMENEMHVAGGKGTSVSEAARRAVFEAIEHLSGSDRPSLPTRLATARELGAMVLLPSDVDGFSDRQQAAPSPPGPPSMLTVPHRLDPDETIRWVWAEPLGAGDGCWMPAAAAFYGCAFDSMRYALATSNGCAAGATADAAARSGLLELIERDAVAIWWYNQIRRPTLAASQLEDPTPLHVQDELRSAGRTLQLIDVTTDIGVPVVVAVSCRLEGASGWVLGFGAGATSTVASVRAVTELAQLVPATDDPAQPNPAIWADTATTDDQPQLSGCGETHEVSLGELALEDLVARLERVGVRAYAVDQTHPLAGVPVVRTVAPGLVHFWRRLGAARLYSVPVDLGWRDAPTDEADMNGFDLTL